MWEFHVDDSIKVIYYTKLGRYILTELLFNIKNFKHTIKGG